MRTCDIDGCDRKHQAKGMCRYHYNKTTQDARRWMVDVPCTHCGKMLRKWQSKRKPFCDQACNHAHMRAERSGSYKNMKEPKPPYRIEDTYSPLRKALEAGDCAAVIAIIESDCTKVNGGCWEWNRSLTREGYAIIKLRRKSVHIHRLSLEARLGRPLGSQPAHHACANRKCVNPDHLQAITHAENTAEMLARGYYTQRIRELERALAALAPNHSLLAEVGVPDAA